MTAKKTPAKALNIDIEKIADGIRPPIIYFETTAYNEAEKENAFDFEGIEECMSKELAERFIKETKENAKAINNHTYNTTFRKQIYTARDIGNLNERKAYFESIIKEQKELETVVKYAPPQTITFNDKILLERKENEIRLQPDNVLIEQCKTEMNKVIDLLYIKILLIEINGITGENQKQLAIFNAKDGHGKNEYHKPKFYTEKEFADIIEAAINYKEKNMNEATPQTAAAPLTWKGTQNEFSELIKALALTVFVGTPETEIIRRFAPLVEVLAPEKKTPTPFNEKRHSININDLQDKPPKELFTSKLNAAINNFLKDKMTK
ncbi:MAG: hypothetical protein JSS64_11630 [Bacteroidetes bacterium]|nr:hypothetical protein [Bacteroidota bacterium]